MKPSYINIEHDTTLNLEHDMQVGDTKCRLGISFMRTLRIPDDNKKYGLPPGVGRFPLKHVEDYPKLPEHWQSHGGVFLPMYQSEAMWLSFSTQWPFAIKVAAGKINAVSGETWSPNLVRRQKVAQVAHDMLARPPLEQAEYMRQIQAWQDSLPKQNIQPDYMVAPKQPWLDGFNVGKGLIRQFVAMPLGGGYTVEEQITGKAEHGGIQIIAYPMKKEAYEKIKAEEAQVRSFGMLESATLCCASAASKGILRNAVNNFSGQAEVGLGAGGYMKQDIYEDPYDGDVWDLTKPLKVFVHLLNSLDYVHVTGEQPPTKPLTPKDYQRYNYPWFDYYDDGPVLEGAEKLSKVDSVGSMEVKKGENVLEDNSSFTPPATIALGQKKKTVKSGNW